jgi:hypothetical protein
MTIARRWYEDVLTGHDLSVREELLLPAGQHDSPPLSMAPPFSEHGGVAPMNPSYTNHFEVDPASGGYAVICFVADPETGAPHFAPGMAAGITVA